MSLWSSLRRQTGKDGTQSPSLDSDGVRVSLQELIALKPKAAGLGLSNQRRVASAQVGGYASPFRGRGIDFEEVRAYQPGDDIRSMDWRVTARRGRPHTKVYREERERPVLLWVDQGTSMQFGTRNAFKSVVAARIAALFAWAADSNGDRVGGLLFSNSHHLEVRPRSRTHGVLPLLKGLADLDNYGSHTGGTQRLAMLQRLQHIARPGTRIIFISDFLDLSHDETRLIQHMARHNDVILSFVYDPIEAAPPPAGRYSVTDGEEIITLDTGNRSTSSAYQQRFNRHFDGLDTLCRQHGLHLLSIGTDQELVQGLYSGMRHRHGISPSQKGERP